MTLDQSYSLADVAAAYGVSEGQIQRLIRAGRVGFIRGARGSKRLLPDHVAQLREAVEVKPHSGIPAHLDGLGLSARSIARRRAG